jgi:hypothetical protein
MIVASLAVANRSPTAPAAALESHPADPENA